jgi:quinol monooxygenase YgiN
MAPTVKTVAILSAKPGRAEALDALLAGMAPHCRAEPGNLGWDVWREKDHPDRFVLDESYVDAAAVDAHRATPHYRDYAAQVGGLAERTVLVLEAAHVA